jgi:hypothetical protein
MTLLIEFPINSFSLGDGGDLRGEATAVPESPFIQLFRQGRYWCVNCGGESTFILVDRFACGWRGYCLGCEETKYVMDRRSSSEVA